MKRDNIHAKRVATECDANAEQLRSELARFTSSPQEDCVEENIELPKTFSIIEEGNSVIAKRQHAIDNLQNALANAAKTMQAVQFQVNHMSQCVVQNIQDAN